MSRLIKKSIALPEGVTITERDNLLTVKGPKGEVNVTVVQGIVVTTKDGGAWITEGKDLMNTAMLGTTWALVRNAIEGATKGFTKKLEIEGVGYRAAIEGKDVVLYLGYAQPVRVAVPEGVTVAVEKNTTILLSGVSKENVGQLAAKIRALKKPEPYKGKGIHYEGEVIRRKVGKKAGTTTA
jgi:large subunit ribosomal protein L6